jgi:hypothetical protein
MSSIIHSLISRSTPALFLGTALALSGGAQAQLAPGVNLPAPDSAGWIKIFRGVQDTGNFYRFMGTTRVVPAQNKQHFLGTNPASPSAPFTVVGGDTIRSAGSPAGHLIFKQTLSHYRVSYQLRWPGATGNTGMLLKVQENDTAQSQGFPRSVECQGDPNQGIGQIWALGSIREGTAMQNGGTWVTFRGRSITHPFGGTARQFDTASPEIHYGGGGDPSNNLIVGLQGWRQPRPAALNCGTGSTCQGNNTGWVTVEADVHGHDTTKHFVEGELVMQYHSPRIAPRNDQAAVMKYLTSGQIAWQSEGSNVYFRNLKIKLYPEDPLYATLYPTNVQAGIPAKAGKRMGSRLIFDRGFPIMIERNGERHTLTGRRQPYSASDVP